MNWREDKLARSCVGDKKGFYMDTAIELLTAASKPHINGYDSEAQKDAEELLRIYQFVKSTGYDSVLDVTERSVIGTFLSSVFRLDANAQQNQRDTNIEDKSRLAIDALFHYYLCDSEYLIKEIGYVAMHNKN